VHEDDVIGNANEVWFGDEGGKQDIQSGCFFSDRVPEGANR
jgi:hypothetical protein